MPSHSDEWSSPSAVPRFTVGSSGVGVQQQQPPFSTSSPQIRQQSHFVPANPIASGVAESPQTPVTPQQSTGSLVAALIKNEQQSTTQDLMEVATMSSDSSSSSDSDSQ